MNVVVIGAGLSGLSAADVLGRAGVRVRVLEARDRPGGRTLSVPLQPEGTTGRLDLGATWGWPHQSHLQRLARELNVGLFQQYVHGDLIFDQPPYATRHAHPSPMTGAFRFQGGAAELGSRLAARLPEGSVAYGAAVTGVNADGPGVRVSAEQGGRPVSFDADAVIVAVPPRVAEHTIEFTPALPAALRQVMLGTPTWMGFSMKVCVEYDRPFWREQGMSGFGVSHVGPLQEIHDASASGSKAGALFGFVGFGHPAREMSAAERQAAVLGQLARMFGAPAGRPRAYLEVDWSREPFSSAPLDRQALRAHPEYGHPLFLQPALSGRVHWAGAETAALEGGLLEGAVRAGERAAQAILARQN